VNSIDARGTLALPGGGEVTRGSVWIEQEIAIAAFIQHVLGRSIPVIFYKQSGVDIEGIRQVLHLNPRVEFTDEEEVLADLRSYLPSASFQPLIQLSVQDETKKMI
jgi:hypothetical protein